MKKTRDKPTILALVQLPPPIHGVTIMNQFVVSTKAIHDKFALMVLPMQFSSTVASIGKYDLKKGVKAILIGIRLFLKCVSRPDLIYFTLVPTGGGFFRDLFYVAIMKAFRVHRVFHLHGKGIQAASASRFNRLLYRWAFKDAHIIHLSPRLYTDIEAFVPQERCHFLPNGIPDLMRKEAASRENSAHQPIHFVFLSNMILTKGPIVMLRALALLKKRGLHFHVSFAGAWFEDDCKRQFNAIMQSERLTELIEYLGPLYGSAKSALLASADVFVFPTMYLRESFPLVIIEAMACSLPVVSTNEGAIPDIVEEGVTGFIVEKNCPEALADRLAILTIDPALRVRFGQAGRKRFLEHFTQERFEKKLVSILDACLSRNRVKQQDKI